MSVLVRWVPLVIPAAIASAIAAYFVSSMLPSEYASRVTLLVGPPLAAEVVTLNDVLVGQALLPTYAELAVTRPLLERAWTRAGVAQLPVDMVVRVTTFIPEDRNTLELTVRDGDPNVAADIANAIATELVNYAEGDAAPANTTAVSLAVIDPAVPPAQAESPRVVANTALAAAVGLIMAISVGFLVENLRPAS